MLARTHILGFFAKTSESMIEAMPTETISKKLFTVDEYLRIWEAGILPEDGRFELIRGEILEMPQAKSPHIGPVNRLTMLMVSRLVKFVIVSVQNAIRIDNMSMPMPDLVLLKPRADYYSNSHALPEDVLLMIEVSHTTHWYDTKIKAPLYAEAGVAEYWIVNVPKKHLEVRTEPVDGEYRRIETFKHGQSIRLSKLPDIEFSVDEILG